MSKDYNAGDASDDEIDAIERNDPFLCYAVSYNYVEIVEVLLKRGVDPNKKNSNGETALHFALGGVHVDSDCKTALVSASNLQNRREIVSLLLRYGADDSICSKEGYTPLQAAQSSKHKFSFGARAALLENYLHIKDEVSRVIQCTTCNYV